MQINNYAIKCIGLVLGTLLAIANLHGQIPGWGEEPSGEPDVHYYPFYDGVQMIELDYLSAYQRKVGYLEQAQPRALTYEMILGPPEPNVYVFRDTNGKIVKQYGEVPSDVDILPVYAATAEIRPHNNWVTQLGGSHILSPFATRFSPYYITGVRSNTRGATNLGLIDSLGNRVLEEAFQEIVKAYGSNVFITIKDGTYQLRDKDLKVHFQSDVVRLQPSLQNPGMVDASKGDNWGLMDERGNWLVPAKYDGLVGSFNDHGLARVSRKGLTGFVNRQGKEVIRCEYRNVSDFSSGLLAVRVNEKWGFLDTTGKMVIEPQFTIISHFSEGLARVANKIDGTYYFGFINTAGEKVIPLIYGNALHFYDGAARVRTDFPSSSHELRIPHSPSDLKGMKGHWITIDREGNEVK